MLSSKKHLFLQPYPGWRCNGPPTSFSHVTSTNVGIRLQDSFGTCKIWRPCLMPVPNYWTWTKSFLQKNSFSGQILIKLRYDNFSYSNTRFTKLWSHDHIGNMSHVIIFSDVMDKLWRHNLYFKMLFRKA